MIPKYAELTVAIVIFLFLFFALFLFSFQKGNRLTKNLLGFLFLALGLAVADVYLQVTETYYRYPQFAYIFNPLPLVYGPIIWLLTKSVTIPNYQIRNKDALHFLPFVLLTVSSIFFYHIQDLEFKREFLRRSNDASRPENMLISAIVLGSIIIYIIWCYLQVKKYRKQIREQVSNVDQINLGWLEHTLVGFSIIIFSSIILQIITSIIGDSWILNLFLLIILFAMLFFIMSSIVRGLRSDTLFSESLPNGQAASIHKKPKTQEKNVDNQQLQILQQWMNNEQPFLNPSLSLKELAQQLQSSPRALSNLINQGLGQSFFDFINSHRIGFAQNKIKNATDKKMTILEVMYASGFNSKSSFNTAFKKHTGLTPTQWKKSNNT